MTKFKIDNVVLILKDDKYSYAGYSVPADQVTDKKMDEIKEKLSEAAGEKYHFDHSPVISCETLDDALAKMLMQLGVKSEYRNN